MLTPRKAIQYDRYKFQKWEHHAASQPNNWWRTSGRTGRVTMIVSDISPNSLSIEMAERYGITLMGYAHKHRFHVYSREQCVGLPGGA